MSYCVNCGVKLDPSLKRCPLCNTPVINPNLMNPQEPVPPYPYPRKKGQVDPVKRTDLAILISVVLAGTAIACGLLNLLVFRSNHWSFYVIGACILLWIFCTPMLIYSRLSVYLTILFDGAAVALYAGIVAYEFPGSPWFTQVALPIIGALTVLVLLFALIYRKVSRSILSMAVVIVLEIAAFTVLVELLTRHFAHAPLELSWSDVVLTCCAVIAAALGTILTRARLREEVRRRMHI